MSVLLRSEYSVRESTLTAVLMLVKRGSPVMLAPGGDVVEIVATRNRRAGYQQQDLLERIHDPPGLAVVRELRKVSQKQGQTRTRTLTLENRVHSGAPVRIRALTESHSRRQLKIAPGRPLT